MPGREIYFVFIILFQLKKREYFFETKTSNISTITINDNNRVAESLPKLESFGIGSSTRKCLFLEPPFKLK